MLPHIDPLQYPAWSLNNALYLLGGVRGVEIGTVMFGLQPDGSEQPAAMDLVRLAFPRRTYTQSHVDYLAEVILEVYAQRESLPGYRIAGQSPVLRHFTIRMSLIGGEAAALNAKTRRTQRGIVLCVRRWHETPAAP